ncbi:coiled-coil domain-containing protein 80-like [Chiloscyllium plagiosum]|uniref:coiled-coil domain-containing protein 80-like n=1 Tax=Chiloscyllium plagiosum TaxID=36176 RepID=UPI001CB7E877|nr:coiled-coil domain-containing protein 80-like [Chiloscyllium plagiosum]
MMSGRTLCLLLLLGLLAAGEDSSPGLPEQQRPEREGSPAPGAGGRPGRNGAPPNRRSDQPPLEATKAKLGALAQFFGKFRLLVLAAPDPSDNSYRLMEQQIDVKSRQLRCHLVARDLLVLILFQEASASPGKLLTVSQEGEVSEQTVGAQEAAQIRQHLSLEEGQFGMVLLRKSMQLYERFPYAVRMEAVLETVDQMPLRKIESVTRRSQQLKCKGGRDRKLGSRQFHHNRRGMVNRTMSNRGMVNRTMSNRGMVNRTMSNRRTINRGMVNRTLINRGIVNRTMVNRTMSNRGTINRGTVQRTMPNSNRGMVNRTMSNKGTINRTLINRGIVNRTMSNRGMVNRTMSNRGTINRGTVQRTMPNSRLRLASPNSQKLVRSKSASSSGKLRTSAPGSRRTLGKRKGSATTLNSIGKRRADSPWSADTPKESPTVPPGQRMMDQIKKKVQQMLVAKHQKPDQRRPILISQNKSQISRTGTHTYPIPWARSTSSPPVSSTMTFLNRPTAGTELGFQPENAVPLKRNQSQLSPAQTVRPGVFESNPSIVQSQDSFSAYQTLENFSSLPPAMSHHTESGHWNNGSPSVQPSLIGPSNPSDRVSHVPHQQETSASNPESHQTMDQWSDSLPRTTLPKTPRVPVTVQPIEDGTRDKAEGELSQLPPERGGGRQRQNNPISVRTRGKKGENKQEGNANKAVRNKGRKNRRNRKNKKNGPRNSKPIDNRELMGLLQHFRNKRRLLLITAPRKDSKLYIHQRDEYLEHLCQLAVRKFSMIAILGSQSNSTLMVEHYQNENELALENPASESANVELIAQLRREFGMSFDEFFMVLVDYDMQVKQYFDVPIPVKILVDYVDTLPSRRLEIEEEKKNGVTCIEHNREVNINKFLSRCPETWALANSTVSAFSVLAAEHRIRHFTLLKLVGSGEDVSGSMEVFPLNGRAEVATEVFSSMLVKGLREHFQISEEHFMLFVIGKDGTINSWYLTPVWSLTNIYELVDSMQLRQEEVQLQETLGISCQEDEYSPHYRGYPEHG